MEMLELKTTTTEIKNWQITVAKKGKQITFFFGKK